MENIKVAVMAVIKEKRSKASASAPFCRDSIVLLFCGNVCDNHLYNRQSRE